DPVRPADVKVAVHDGLHREARVPVARALGAAPDREAGDRREADQALVEREVVEDHQRRAGRRRLEPRERERAAHSAPHRLAHHAAAEAWGSGWIRYSSEQTMPWDSAQARAPASVTVSGRKL